MSYIEINKAVSQWLLTFNLCVSVTWPLTCAFHIPCTHTPEIIDMHRGMCDNTWGPPVATHSSLSGNASGKSSSILTLTWPQYVKTEQARARNHHCRAPVCRTLGLTWSRFCRPYMRTGSLAWPRWTATHLRTCRTSFMTYHLSSRVQWCLERMLDHIWPGSARPPVWSAGPRCPWLVAISPAGCWSQHPCCDGISSTVSWSRSCTSSCSTISAGVFRP